MDEEDIYSQLTINPKYSKDTTTVILNHFNNLDVQSSNNNLFLLYLYSIKYDQINFFIHHNPSLINEFDKIYKDLTKRAKRLSKQAKSSTGKQSASLSPSPSCSSPSSYHYNSQPFPHYPYRLKATEKSIKIPVKIKKLFEN